MKTKVFIVDDSEIMQNMLKKILEEDEDIEVVGVAVTGPRCIIMIDETEPDIIFIDSDITGGMDVMDTIREIKRINDSIKIILCSDAKTNDKIIPAAEIGAIDFIKKPYIKSRVLRTINDAKNK